MLLEQYIQAANKAPSLNELLTGGILDKGRKLKTSAGEAYFVPAAMVAFTRFSFLMRRVFFRLMHQDLNAIMDGLRELESSWGEQPGLPESAILGGRADGSSAHDLPVVEGDVPRGIFFGTAAANAGGFARCRRYGIKKNRAGKPKPAKAQAAAASAGFTVSASDAPEFEVAPAAPGLDKDFSNPQSSKDDENA